MRIRPMPAYVKLYDKLPQRIQELADKQLALLSDDPRHPSLDFKPRRGRKGVWTVRVTRDYRIVMKLVGDEALLAAIGPHDIIDRV